VIMRTRPLVLAALLATTALAAAAPLPAQWRTKTNLASLAIGVPQVGVERRTGPKRTLQLDLTVSPWRSVRGKPFQFALLISEWRWHRNSSLLGWYVGANVGATVFHLQKPFYWGTDYFQDGFGATLGGSVGYKWNVGERWTIDAFAGGGTIQTLYKGTLWSTGERYDTLSAPGWNESGELVPYRAGLMLMRR
jgi:hypothetical protein